MQSIENPKRTFVKSLKEIMVWEDLESYLLELKNREIGSKEDLKNWFSDRSELESIISEDLAWRYINMTRYTENESYNKNIPSL